MLNRFAKEDDVSEPEYWKEQWWMTNNGPQDFSTPDILHVEYTRVMQELHNVKIDDD
jgi:hypothetical protein